jgi:hypothetical protein
MHTALLIVFVWCRRLVWAVSSSPEVHYADVLVYHTLLCPSETIQIDQSMKWNYVMMKSKVVVHTQDVPGSYPGQRSAIDLAFYGSLKFLQTNVCTAS